MAHLVFIHGIANKPPAKELLKLWRRSLAHDNRGDPGVNLKAKGINSSLIYWADVMYGEADTSAGSNESGPRDEPVGLPTGIEESWQEGFDGTDEADWLRSFGDEYGIDPNAPMADAPTPKAANDLELIPLPWVIKRPFMKLFARDTHHYLFNKTHTPRPGDTYQVRDEIRRRFVDTLKEAAQDGGPLIVLAHSQGTVITYDCLKNVPDCPRIDGLVTVGSPLGLHEVQVKLQPGYTRKDGFPSEKVAGDWRNIYDPLDIVSRPDPWIANDFLKAGEKIASDHKQTNRGAWRHAMTEYLAGAQVRNALRIAFALPDPNA